VLNRTGNIKLLLIVCIGLIFIGNTPLFAQEEKAKEHFNAGIEAEEADDKAKAIAEYTEAITVDATYASPHLNIGVIYFSQKKYKSAFTHFKTYTELMPEDLEGWKNLGLASTETNNLTVGSDAFTKALKIKPNDIELTEAYAMLYYKNGAYKQAELKLDALVKLEVRDKKIFYALGKTYQETGKIQSAIANFESATKLDPKYYLAFFELGNIYLDQQAYEKAIKNYEKAVAIKSNHYQSWFNLGSSCVGASTAESVVDAYDAYKKFLQLSKGKNGVKKMRADATAIMTQLKDYFIDAGIDFEE
jgi:tetratricopeptide (TPR) repeat protein